jgi:Xaa-Pro aminopeptidase
MGLGGVRIEDNAVITADGHVNLTMAAGVPKEVREIEDLMAAAAGQHN